MTYANSTDVSPGRSREEIERTLIRYKASQFGYGWEETRAVIGFVMCDRQIRFILPMPDRQSKRFTQTATGRARTFDQEFGMHMVLPDGSVVADLVMPGVNHAYLTGTTPQLLALGS